LVICLQLDIALLVQNSAKIWHCLSELWQCIQGVTFSWTQCILTATSDRTFVHHINALSLLFVHVIIVLLIALFSRFDY